MKVHIKTHGCQMNVYDSQVVMRLLDDAFGATQVEEEACADLLVLNTCSIREKAQEKVFSQLGRWRTLKEANPQVCIAVAGCVASQEGELLLKRAPYVDCVIGPQTIHKLPEMVRTKQQAMDVPAQVDTTFTPIDKFDAIPVPQITGPESFVTIMEGCDKFCTFCVVPYTRGAEVSRNVSAVLREVDQCVAQGASEITLLGQNVNGYKSIYQTAGTTHLVDFGTLLLLVAQREGVQRVRFTTSHPIECDESLYHAFATEEKIVSHMHLPVQSGSDAILQRMKRKHTIDQYLDIIDSLRKVRPDITFSSDFIVGFPEETEDDFAATLDLVRRVGFDVSYSFIYSARAGTPAAQVPDSVSLAVKKNRLEKLQTLLKQTADDIAQRMVGLVVQVLVNGYSKKSLGKMQGRTPNNRIVHFDSLDASFIGQIVPVRIERILPNSLIGTLLNEDVHSDTSVLLHSTQ